MEFQQFVRTIFINQIDFLTLEKQYKIDLLCLHKLTLQKIIELYQQIQHKYTIQTKKLKTWFQNELRIFIWIIFHYSSFVSKNPSQLSDQQWCHISQYFHKDDLTCKYFFLCIEKNRKSQWSPQEDKMVMDAVNKSMFTNQWTDVGKQMFISSKGAIFKKPKQIRQRWNNYLNPNISKDKWSIEEDLLLFRIFAKQGRKWALISKILKTRSQHSVKNRYTNLFKKFKTQFPTFIKLKKSEIQLQFVKITLKKLQQKKQFPNFKQQKQHNGLEYHYKNQNDKTLQTLEDTKSSKYRFQDQIDEKSVDLQFIKYPLMFEDNCDDFMSNENLIKSFQPSHQLYLL